MKTLVVGPSMGMRGGINTVISTHASSTLWQHWGCVWIETVTDTNAVFKLLFGILGFLKYLFLLPGTGLVHIHLTFGTSALRKRVFFESARFLRIPVIVHLHAPSYDERHAAHLFSGVRSMFKRATAVIALSQSWKRNILMHVPEARVQILLNVVECPDSVPDIFERDCTIFCAGKLEPRKGYQDLLYAFAAIADDNPGWRLEFAGNGEVVEARAIAEKLGISDRVVIHGWVDRPAMLGMLERARLFCLPSFAEGFPMSVLEAFAAGCTVVATPVGGLPDELVDNEDIVFFPPGDPKSLSQALSRLIGDSATLGKLSKRGRELSRTRFSRDAAMECLQSIYEEACA